MTVDNSTLRISHDTDGAVKDFTYNFRIFEAGDLAVSWVDSGGNPGSVGAYTVDGVGSYAGGSIHLSTAPADGGVITIERKLPISQLLSMANQSQFYTSNIEEGLDRQTMIQLQMFDLLDRVIVMPPGSPASLTFPQPSNGKLIGWNGTVLANFTFAASVNGRAGAVTLNGTDIPAFVASGTSHAPGAVPDPGSSAGTTRYLREDSSWQVPPGFANPMNAAGDLIVGGSSGTPQRLAKGSDGQVLTMVSGAQAWVNPGGGSTFQTIYGDISIANLTPFPNWLDQGSNTATNQPNGVGIYTAPNTGDHFRGVYGSLPSAPYTIEMGFLWMHDNGGSVLNADHGFFFYDAGLGTILSFTQFAYASVFRVVEWSSSTTPATVLTNYQVNAPIPFFLKIHDDGTNWYFYASADRFNWQLIYQIPRNTFLTPNNYGVGGTLNDGALNQRLTLIHHKVSTP